MGAFFSLMGSPEGASVYTYQLPSGDHAPAVSENELSVKRIGEPPASEEIQTFLEAVRPPRPSLSERE